MRLPRLYPIADIGTLAKHGLALESFAQQIVAGGAEIVQLRDKHSAPQEVLRHAALLTQALAASDCLPVMNDRADLAVLAGWRAVHVGHLDLPPEAVRRVFSQSETARNVDLIVGVSTHNEQQVIAADAGLADYIAVGPVFATGTKADAEPVIGLKGVRRARDLTRKPIVAIGGITRGNAPGVIDAGADSVALIGGLFSEGESVEQVVRDFLRRLR